MLARSLIRQHPYGVNKTIASILVLLPNFLTHILSAQESPEAFSHDDSGLTGYGVSHRDALCIVTPIIPDEELKGGSFSLPSGKKFNAAKATVIEQPGTRIHIFPKTDYPKALPYTPEFTLKQNDRLIAASPDGRKVEGTFYYHPANCEDYSSDMGPVYLSVFTDDPDVEPDVEIGWPVYSKDSGKLVGTVAVHRSIVKPYKHVTFGGRYTFEPLCLPSTEKKEPELMNSYGGVKFIKPVDKASFRWLLPACLWNVEVGISKEELTEKRGDLAQGREDFKEDTPFTLRYDTPVCRQLQYISGNDQDSRDRIVEIKLEGDAKLYLGEFPRAKRMISALVDAFGEPRLLKANYDENSSGGRQFVAHWLSGDRSLTLQMDRYSTEMRTQISISETKTTKALEVVMKHRKLSKGANTVAVFDKWIEAQDKK